MAIQGHLSTIKIPELFSFLHQMRKTGTLCLVSDQEERSFVFQHGNLVYATTKDMSRRLGSYLVRLGIVDTQDLESSVERSLEDGQYFGEILVSSGKATAEQLRSAVREQMLDILHETFTWPNGAFHFDENEVPFNLPEGAHVPTQSLLFEVTSKSDERQCVKEIFPEGNVVLALENGAAKEKELSDDEKELLDRIDGKSTVEQILFQCPGNLMNTAQTLHTFVDRGLVRTASVNVETPKTPATPELRCLPVAPEIPGRIFALFNNEGSFRTELIEVLSQDPMLTAKLLRALTLNNVELPRSLLKIEHLIDVLGPFELRSLLLPEALRGLFFPVPECFWGDCWQHSVLTAQLCRLLAHATGYSQPGEAHLAGLLHNLGVYVLLHQDPQRYRQVVVEAASRGAPLEVVEEELLGISHTRLGGIYADKWNFPRFIISAIRHHHKVDDKVANPLLHIVFIANHVIQQRGVGIEPLPHDGPDLAASLSNLELDDCKLEAIIANASRSRLHPYWALRQTNQTMVKTGDS